MSSNNLVAQQFLRGTNLKQFITSKRHHRMGRATAGKMNLDSTIPSGSPR